jgi:CelD/BcsL family acetyltransferase involved in cellulose biosynthesis
MTSSRLLAIRDLTETQVGRWRELALQAEQPNPFFEPEFVLPLAATVSMRASLLVAERDGEWIGAMPVRNTAAWHRIPLPGTVSWRTHYTYLGLPLLRGDHAGIAARTLVEAGVRRPRYLGLDLLDAAGPVTHALEESAFALGFSTTVLRRHERAALHRRPGPEDYVDLKPKHRRERRRQRDRLAEQLGSEIEAHDESGSDRAVADFLRLEASGWKRETGTAMSSLEGHGEMFRQICRQFDASGRLQMLVLRAGERPLAAKCNLRAGEGAFCFKIAFDESLARFSPGIQLELANIDFFHRDPQLKWLDSCAEPNNEMINRLWQDRRAVQVTAVTPPGAGRVGRWMFEAAAATDQAIRRRNEARRIRESQRGTT